MHKKESSSIEKHQFKPSYFCDSLNGHILLLLVGLATPSWPCDSLSMSFDYGYMCSS